MIVAGADGCVGGWAVMKLDVGEPGLAFRSFAVVPAFSELLADDQVHTIAVDIPIGLLDEPTMGGRACDFEARLWLGTRSSSIFSPPTRASLRARSYADAKAICSMSRQSYGLMKKIAEVDALLTPELQERIIETHPESAFAALNGAPMWWSKQTTAGRAERLDVLSRYITGIEHIARRRQRHLHVDDILDSGAAALVAARRALGVAERIPRDPPRDARGLRMEIWT